MRNSAVDSAIPLAPQLPGFEHFRRYWVQARGRYAVKVKPGEYYVTDADEMVATVLGSCVSACIRDPALGLGGLNHFMLPHGAPETGAGGAVGISRAMRYGSVAMERLINEIIKHGGRRERLEAKLVGGGMMLSNIADIGRKNIQFVKRYLQREAIPVVAEDLGGYCPRKVLYLPHSGRLLVKKLERLQATRLLRAEHAYRQQVETDRAEGEVELF